MSGVSNEWFVHCDITYLPRNFQSSNRLLTYMLASWVCCKVNEASSIPGCRIGLMSYRLHSADGSLAPPVLAHWLRGEEKPADFDRLSVMADTVLKPVAERLLKSLSVAKFAEFVASKLETGWASSLEATLAKAQP